MRITQRRRETAASARIHHSSPALLRSKCDGCHEKRGGFHLALVRELPYRKRVILPTFRPASLYLSCKRISRNRLRGDAVPVCAMSRNGTQVARSPVKTELKSRRSRRANGSGDSRSTPLGGSIFMKRTILIALTILASAAFASAQISTPTGDVLGAHLNYGRGCAACHVPHSGVY